VCEFARIVKATVFKARKNLKEMGAMYQIAAVLDPRTKDRFHLFLGVDKEPAVNLRVLQRQAPVAAAHEETKADREAAAAAVRTVIDTLVIKGILPRTATTAREEPDDMSWTPHRAARVAADNPCAASIRAEFEAYYLSQQEVSLDTDPLRWWYETGRTRYACSLCLSTAAAVLLLISLFSPQLQLSESVHTRRVGSHRAGNQRGNRAAL
jgi:hypothetical protein